MKRTILFSILMIASVAFAADVKQPDLAGSWYPGSREALERELRGYLGQAAVEKSEANVFAIIVPHAGYRFSGPIAAYAYNAAKTSSPKTVIIIGFTHRKPFDGIAIYDRGSFLTPLGEAAVDSELASAIEAQSSRVRYYPAAFDDENSVEMQIPFVQEVFKGASIVPIAFGTQSYDDAVILGKALAEALKNKDGVLIVASTDMSHYHPYDKAGEIDARAINLLKDMKAKELYDEARLGICELCGIMPVTATIIAARALGYDKIRILKYANSGDTSGDKSKVVGYVSAAIYKEHARDRQQAMVAKEGDTPMLNDAQKKRLLQIARESITSFVRDGNRKRFEEKDPVLNEHMGVFVTLHEGGELRGCIGNMMGSGPLYQTVADMAIEAATGDPRFPVLSPKELNAVDIEISALSPMKRVASHEEIVVPGNGVLVRRGFRSGVYLPQVATETGWNKEEFLSSLCAHKAGLSQNAWKDPATELYVFTADVFGEKEMSR